jgi:hypothetical protein
MGFGGPIKKKKFFVCGKTSFYFHQRQLAVVKTPNTNFLDPKIDQGSDRQCHSSAHFDLRTSFCRLRSLKSAGKARQHGQFRRNTARQSPLRK